MNELPEQYKDTVVLGDVMETLRALPDNCLNMIYGDPDYGVGINYAGKKYIQRWEEYISWYVDLATECMRVLRDDGNLFFINYPRQNSYLRVRCLDDLAYEVFDYVWVYPTNVGHTPRRFTTAHRSVMHAVKSKKNAFYKEQVALPYKNPEDRRIKGRIANGSNGRMPYSWFEFNLVKNVSKDKTFHACQIPIPLYDMLLNASTIEGDSVFVLFGGSGSEIMHARQKGRHFLSCEIHHVYHEMIIERLNYNGYIYETHRIDMRKEQSLSGGLVEQPQLFDGFLPTQSPFPHLRGGRMTNQNRHLTYQDVKPHVFNYVVNSYPVEGKIWDYTWYYNNGADTVKITLTINGQTDVHQVPVLSIVGDTSV